MNLLDEDFQDKKETGNKKILRVVLVLIILIVFSIIGIISYLMYLESTNLKVSLNDQINNDVKNLIVFEQDGSIYLPVRAMSSFLGYNCYNGEYSNKSEESSKCYVQCEGEIANLVLNSNKIYKLNLEESDDNYTYIFMDKPVKAINGELYVTADGFEKVFNTSFNYDKDKNRISMYTTNYLVSIYENKVLDYGYTKLSDKFENTKTTIKNMLVVTNDKAFGVVNATDGTEILECKYDDIKYQETTGDFIVSCDGKYGIIGADKKTKINLAYDEIKLMDYEEGKNSGLYVVKRNNKYGVIDFKGNDKIYAENDQIGVDISKFEENDLKSGYVLVDNLIPVKKNDKWGLFDKSGKKIVDFEYDDLGYIANNNKDATNLLVIPNYNVIVACLDGRYTLLNASGEQPIKAFVDDIYMTISGGVKHYTMIANNKSYDVEEYLDKLGVRTTKNSSNQSTNNTNTNNNTEGNTTNTNEQQSDENSEDNNNQDQNDNQEQNNNEDNNDQENNQDNQSDEEE